MAIADSTLNPGTLATCSSFMCAAVCMKKMPLWSLQRRQAMVCTAKPLPRTAYGPRKFIPIGKLPVQAQCSHRWYSSVQITEISRRRAAEWLRALDPRSSIQNTVVDGGRTCPLGTSLLAPSCALEPLISILESQNTRVISGSQQRAAMDTYRVPYLSTSGFERGKGRSRAPLTH